MTLNGCSKKLCPMQVGSVDNCNLTKEQCPYFTQDIDYLKVLNLIKAEVAREIFEEIDSKILAEIDINNGVLVEFEGADEPYHRIKGEVSALCKIQDFIAELKKKYTEENKDET